MTIDDLAHRLYDQRDRRKTVWADLPWGGHPAHVAAYRAIAASAVLALADDIKESFAPFPGEAGWQRRQDEARGRMARLIAEAEAATPPAGAGPSAAEERVG